MAVVIVEIRKRKYVCGLFWHSLSQPRELKSEAVELSRKLNFDLFVLRKDLGVAQAGFASTREGAHGGMLSLGAIVATTVAANGVQQGERRQPATNWLAAFRLEAERWVYFAVRDESFLPAGDFSGTQAEVMERLYADYGLGGWNAVIGDPELADQGFHHFNPATIDDFLPRSSSGRLWLASAWELVPVERSRKLFVLATGVTAGLVAVVGAIIWTRQRAATEVLERERAMMSAQQRLASEQATFKPPPPWLDEPSPQELTRACSGNLSLLFPGGWKLDEYACSSQQRSYTWSRGDSNVAYLLEHVPRAQIELGGDKAHHAEAMSLKPGPAEELLAADVLLNGLSARFQMMGMRLAVKPPPAEIPRPVLPGVRQSTPAAQAWRSYTFSLQSGGLPLIELASALSQPGVRIKNLTFRQGEWFIEGAAYAK